jgi:molybdopterin converting factor small subunit
MTSEPAPQVEIAIPHRLRPLAGEERVVRVSARSVGEALEALVERHPALRSRLRDGDGKLRPSVLFFLNSEDIRAKDGEATPVSDGDTLTIVPVADGG